MNDLKQDGPAKAVHPARSAHLAAEPLRCTLAVECPLVQAQRPLSGSSHISRQSRFDVRWPSNVRLCKHSGRSPALRTSRGRAASMYVGRRMSACASTAAALRLFAHLAAEPLRCTLAVECPLVQAQRPLSGLIAHKKNRFPQEAALTITGRFI